MSVTQSPSGNPLPTNTANAADTIALLAKVNLGSVHKVLAAIHAISVHLDLNPREVVALADVPTEPPLFDGSDAERCQSTIDLARAIAADKRLKHLDSFLHLRGRFRQESRADSA